MDLIARAPRIPMPVETILGNSVASGVKGANQATAAGRLEAATLVGCVGADAYGHQLHVGLQMDGMNT
jgi:ribokinase